MEEKGEKVRPIKQCGHKDAEMREPRLKNNKLEDDIKDYRFGLKQ